MAKKNGRLVQAQFEQGSSYSPLWALRAEEGLVLNYRFTRVVSPPGIPNSSACSCDGGAWGTWLYTVTQPKTMAG